MEANHSLRISLPALWKPCNLECMASSITFPVELSKAIGGKDNDCLAVSLVLKVELFLQASTQQALLFAILNSITS